MRLVCQQPHYLPWLGYFELFARTDLFVFLDDVQWTRQGRQHRTKLLRPDGAPLWLTVPVKSRGHRGKTLKEMEVDTESGWGRRHWETVKACYGKAPRFRDQVEPLLRPYFEKMKEEKFLVDICQEALWCFWEPLGLKTELHWASDSPVKSAKNEKLIGLCRQFGAEEYYSSLGSTRYVDLSKFREFGIRVFWQHFRGSFPADPLRPSDLSIVDWIAHHDFTLAREALKPLPRLEDLALPGPGSPSP